MKPFLVLYATRDGHTRRIADRVHGRIQARGHAVEVHDVGGLAEPFDLYRYRGAIIAASIHGGEHEPEMVEFVKRHRSALEQISAAFLSVSLREAAVEDTHRAQALREKDEAEVHAKIAAFLDATEWHPRRVQPVAGALLYSRRSAMGRFVMRLRAKLGGTSTDTRQDHDYTDWEMLEGFVDDFVDHVCESAPPSSSRGEVLLL